LVGADVFGMFGLILAIAGIVISIYYGRKSLLQRLREIRWSAESIPLLSQDIEPFRSKIEVLVGGYHVPNPHLVRLCIKNIGKLDLESRMFDKDRPIIFHLSGTKYFHMIELGSPAVRGDQGRICVGPELLKSGEQWIISFLADRDTRVERVEQHLSNVQVLGSTINARDNIRADIRYRQVALTSAMIAGIVLILTFLVMLNLS